MNLTPEKEICLIMDIVSVMQLNLRQILKFLNGQAVVLGMIAANIAAQKRGLLSAENEKFLREKVLFPVFKTNMKNIKINIEDTIAAMAHDKKNTGEGLALVMINDDYEMIKITDMQKKRSG